MRILIILYKILIITGKSNEKTNELNIYGILCRNVTIFYQQELAYLVQPQRKSKACRSSKLNFSSSCFIADDSQVKIAWLLVVVFSEYHIFHFWDNVHFFKHYPVKVPQNCFNSFNCSNQTCTQVSKFSFPQDKSKKKKKRFNRNNKYHILCNIYQKNIISCVNGALYVLTINHLLMNFLIKMARLRFIEKRSKFINWNV